MRTLLRSLWVFRVSIRTAHFHQYFALVSFGMKVWDERLSYGVSGFQGFPFFLAVGGWGDGLLARDG